MMNPAVRRLPLMQVARRHPLIVGLIVAFVGASAALAALWPASGHADWMPFWFPVPSEDSYILYRYSQHLSDGYGIVWNIGAPPVDGSTDFLWMLLLSAWAAVFGAVIPGNYILGVLFAIVAASAGYVALRALRRPLWPGRAFALLVLVSPMAYHILNGFGVPLYVALLGLDLTLFFVNTRPMGSPTSKRTSVWAVVMLLAGLARPEANILNVSFLAASLLLSLRRRDMRLSQYWPVLVYYVLPGAAFLAFRLAYFGEVLPAPFFVKSEFGALPSLVLSNFGTYAIPTLIPCLLLAVPVFWNRKNEAFPVWLGALGAIFTLFGVYQLFSQDQNQSYRFEYPAYFLTLLVTMVSLGCSPFVRTRAMLVALGSLLFGWALYWALMPVSGPSVDSRWPAGEMLRQYRGAGYTLATTEAGAVPYISEWRTLDTFGLNNYAVAHEGLTQDQWQSYAPALVLNHSTTALEVPRLNDSGNRLELYERMRESGNYVPVAAVVVRKPLGFTRPNDYHIYFLRTDIPHFEELAARLRQLPGQTYVEIPPELTAYFRSHK